MEFIINKYFLDDRQRYHLKYKITKKDFGLSKYFRGLLIDKTRRRYL